MKLLLRHLALIGSVFAVTACGEETAAPVQIPLDTIDFEPLGFASVSAGPEHTCAISAPGNAYCWGRNPSGALGLDSVTRTMAPGRVAADLQFARVTVGAEHSCATSVAGATYCWGSGSRGQLGTREAITQLTPVPIGIPQLAFRGIVAGAYHTCAVTTNAVPYCWGWNADGQIGNNSTIGQMLPVEVHGDLRVSSISAGTYHTCAVNMDGAVYCWGKNDKGQIGDGTRTNRLGATRVSSGRQFVQVSAGLSHTCAVATDGSAWCWGDGSTGQLGNGSQQDATVPVAVAGNVMFKYVSAAAEHTCAISTDGTVYCWGHNNFGRLGIGGLATIFAQPNPVAADTLRFKNVSTGRLHSCAVTESNALYCWGFGGFGQLGDGTILDHVTPNRVVVRDTV